MSTETALYGDVIYRKVGVCVSEKELGPEDYALERWLVDLWIEKPEPGRIDVYAGLKEGEPVRVESIYGLEDASIDFKGIAVNFIKRLKKEGMA